MANNYLLSGAALGVAIAFLASALTLVIVAAAPERRFYSRYFDAQSDFNGLTFYLYAASLLLLAGLGVFIVCGITIHFAASVALTIVAAVYFVSEKLVDEVLRLRLFERDFASWGRINILRSVLQLAGLGAAIGIIGRSVPAWAIVSVLVVGNAVAVSPQLPSGLGRGFGLQRLRAAFWLMRRALRSLAASWTLWAMSLLSAGVGYLDRLVALVLDKASLPLFMLVVMCFSIVQMTVDFYYVSRHRRDFLEQRMSLGRIFSSRAFVGSVGIGLALGAVACAIALNLSHNGADFPFGYIVVIAVLQLCVALAAVPREILYWSRFFKRVLLVEILFWAVFICAALVSWALRLPAMMVFTIVAICALLRLALYIMNGSRIIQHPYVLSEQANR